MALDRQKILGELGSVMQQLQNANCGCLGKLFGNQQAAAPTMGSPLPTCGGCRRACCRGHGCNQYLPQTGMNQPAPNMNYMAPDASNYSQQPMAGNMYGYGPQIVNMMKGDHSKSQKATGYSQGQAQELTGPMVIDAPQSPHGKVGLTPFTPPSMAQQGYFNPDLNHGDVAGQIQNQFIPAANTGNIANANPWSQQNANINSPAGQANSAMNSWPQPTMSTNLAAHQTSTPHSNPHGQHAEGIAKFNKMFPGVKQGMGGDLGFDPMAIAIQMNPDNHLKSAMDTMNKIMNGNKGMDQTVAGNTINQNPPAIKAPMQQNAVPGQVVQGHIQEVTNQVPVGQVMIPNQGSTNQPLYTHIPNQGSLNQPTYIPNQGSPNQPQTYVPNQGSPNQPQTYVPSQGSLNQPYTNANVYGQPIPPQNQQIYAATADPNVANQQMRYEDNQQSANNDQYGQRQMMDLNSTVPNLPVIQNEITAEDNQLYAPPEDLGYPNQAPMRQMIKEPIFPVDTSKNHTYIPTKQEKNHNYGYNTLGQPVEMLPAKMYHPPEPSLPQTLSPQPDPVKSRSNLVRVANVKATISKTSLMGNKQVGKTPSRAQLQNIYNQYKGSQSVTQHNVRHPGEGTYSDGRINIPHTAKSPPVPVERVGGDTVVNNSSIQERSNKVEQVMGQIGDVPASKPTGDSLPLKEAPVPIRKCRNGLQDMVFSSYPTSAAWTFHGHGRADSSPTRPHRHRQY